MRVTRWSAEQTQAVRHMAEVENLTSREISLVMKTTRNAVIGHASRKGITLSARNQYVGMTGRVREFHATALVEVPARTSSPPRSFSWQKQEIL